MDTTKPFLGSKSHLFLDKNKDPISLVDLSELSGYPIELIRSELQFEGDEISMEELRKKMLLLLESTMESSN